MRRVYLDNNATTPLAPEVFEAMKPFLLDDFGNPSSVHAYGQKARAAVDQARERLAGLLNARPNEIVFTSGGTEGNRTVTFDQSGKHWTVTFVKNRATEIKSE